MTKRFCTDCETLHEGRCSPTALARAGKGKRLPQGARPVGAAPVREALKPAETPRPAAPKKIEPVVPPETVEELRARLATVDAEKAAVREATRKRVAAWRAGQKKGRPK